MTGGPARRADDHTGAMTRHPGHATPARVLSAAADDSGAATAEYAIATLAAVGLAGVLVAILRGDEVRALLTDLVRRALSADQ